MPEPTLHDKQFNNYSNDDLNSIPQMENNANNVGHCNYG